jgi:nitrite reductase/ring-hydroxylating ferredoxin subunit
MEKTCSGECEQPNHQHKELSRKALLSGLAVLLSGIGLTNLSATAEAAAKKYKVTATKNVPVGSAKTFTVKSSSILITQPRAGVFRAFTNTCTHQGAQLGSQKITSGRVMCKQHGATFDASTGAVLGGPAPKALTRYTASSSGSYIYVTI